jgi:hypothetical protein
MKSSILIEVNDLLLEEEETDAFYALTCAIFNMGLIACQSVVSFAAFSD